MLILVTGTRWATIADHGLIVQRAILAGLTDDGSVHEIYVGDAKGVDLIARQIARQQGFDLREFEARWEECAAECPAGHRRRYQYSRDDYCPTAGLRRNQTMVAAFVADGGKQVLAFPGANVRSGGTRSCIKDARKAGLVVADENIIALEVGRHA